MSSQTAKPLLYFTTDKDYEILRPGVSGCLLTGKGGGQALPAPLHPTLIL